LEYYLTVEDPAVIAKPYLPQRRTLMIGEAGMHATEQCPCRDMEQEHPDIQGTALRTALRRLWEAL
jgi:hypothetical protein